MAVEKWPCTASLVALAASVREAAGMAGRGGMTRCDAFGPMPENASVMPAMACRSHVLTRFGCGGCASRAPLFPRSASGATSALDGAVNFRRLASLGAGDATWLTVRFCGVA